jgi:CBS domain-containing protein
MFLVRSAEGIQRALIPGEFRSRRTVEAVTHALKSQEVSGSFAQGVDTRSHREQLLARYQGSAPQPEPTEVCFAREIMTSPVFSVAPSATIQEITRIFTEKRFRHIPVVSPDGHLIGLVSDRDVLRYRAVSGRNDAHPESKAVQTIMVREVLSASPSARIRELAQVMLDERVGSMPIVDSADSLVGIITRSDIVRAIVRHGPVRLWA